MLFLKKLEALKQKYSDNTIVRKNGTVLLDPQEIPRARHMLFAPVPQLVADLIRNLPFPEQYADFLLYTNGANLFNAKRWFIMKNGKRSERSAVAMGFMTVYGFPRVPPFERQPEMEEAYDIRTENKTNRHEDISERWLKIITYRRADAPLAGDVDVFYDPDVKKFFACVSREKSIIESWDSFDECLCTIFDSLENIKDEYETE